MAISLKHSFVSPVLDEVNPNEVGPDEWNAEHLFTMAADRLLGRLTTAGAVQELTAAQVAALITPYLAGVLLPVRLLASTAVPVAHPGTVGETVLATVTVPANSMGANGWLRISCSWSHAASAAQKIMRLRFGGIAGTVYATTSNTGSVTSSRMICDIQNRNATNSQVGAPGTGNIPITWPSSTVDTTVDTTIVFAADLNGAAPPITLERYSVELFTAA